MTEQDLNFPEVSLSELTKKYPNKFLLSVAVSKRAKQLYEGAKPFVEVDLEKPFSPIQVALKEVLEGFVDISIEEEIDEELKELEDLDKNLQDELEKEEEAVEDTKKKPKDSKKSKKSLATS